MRWREKLPQAGPTHPGPVNSKFEIRKLSTGVGFKESGSNEIASTLTHLSASTFGPHFFGRGS